MQVKTHIQGGALTQNHNQPVQLKSRVRSGGLRLNHA